MTAQMHLKFYALWILPKLLSDHLIYTQVPPPADCLHFCHNLDLRHAYYHHLVLYSMAVI